MTKPKHVKSWIEFGTCASRSNYEIAKERCKDIFMKYLSNKHNKPYGDISPKDMTDTEIELWKEVEAMNGNIVGISFKNRLH